MDTIEWLLAGDRAVRWQVMRDLANALPVEVAAERARVEHEGWGARLLELEDDDGQWAGGACFPGSYRGGEPGQPWTSTMHTLQTLQLLGLDPASDSAKRAIALVTENCRWEHDGQRYFEGEVEPCINGRTIETGAYFGADVSGVVDRILGEGLADGGWNCEAENGSVRSSFDTTINVLEGLLEYEQANGGSPELAAARHSGEEYLLERSRRAAAEPEPRMAEAIDVVRSKQQADGRWLLDRIYPGRVHFEIEAEIGAPSRWNTLRALRVLDWWDRAA